MSVNCVSLMQFSLPISGEIDFAKRSRFNAISLDIFQFLDSFETTSISLVCKGWKDIILFAKSRLFFVAKQVNFIFGNAELFSTYDYYLLGGVHKDRRCKAMYNDLNNGLSSQYFVVVLMEGFPSMNPVPDWFVKFITGIDPSLNKNIIFLGWDAIEYYNEAREDIIFQKKTDDQIQELANLEKKLIEERLSADEGRVLEINKEIEKLHLIFDILHMQAENSEEEMLRRTFPKRTNSMVQTLELLEKMRVQGTRKVKIVLECGNEHLRVKRAKLPEYQLDVLYKAVAKLNAIGMIPKFCVNAMPLVKR